MAMNEPNIVIAGCGPGSPEYLTQAVIREVEKAAVLVGAKRLLDLFPNVNAEKVELDVKISDTLQKLTNLRAQGKIVILVSGDPGIHSLAKLVLKKFGDEKCRVIPGISSVQTAFAELGLDWADCRIISAHKEDPNIDPDEVLSKFNKIAVLGGRKNFLSWLINFFNLEKLEDRRIILLENLTLGDQKITAISPNQPLNNEISTRSIVLILKKDLIA